ncbi:hypothetical protein QVD17_13158 [Tagetes erecta]|uniref:Uncharacterized protein n=1 Tax=Tagetes erecta TaxID=13708 RepID=A0AAD8KVL5_TARER|nr:hypothetical protein QVD17_13158 [Tagetes erecta]
MESIKEQGELGLWESEIRVIEVKAESQPLSSDDLQKHGSLKQKISIHHERRNLDIRQKARARWALEGDENSSYFHGLFKAHSSSNRINGMVINGNWSTSPDHIKNYAFEFFKSKFSEPLGQRPTFLLPSVATLSEVEKGLLISIFNLEEIRMAVWDCGNDKSPGPDGFTFGFIKDKTTHLPKQTSNTHVQSINDIDPFIIYHHPLLVAS